MFATLGWPTVRPVPTAFWLLLAALLPLVLHDQFWMGALTLALIWTVLNQSWNLVLGYSGIWNFGHLAIYALGGYTAALISLHWNWPAPLAILAAGVVSLAGSLLLALPSLRLRGIYVSLLTFSFAEVVRLLITADRTGFTGGTFGLSGFVGYGLTGMGPEARQRAQYWIALSVVVISTVVLYFVIRSPLGTGLRALRDNPSLAAARGISPRKYQFVSFGIAGFFGGVAGSLYAFNFEVISPSVMGLAPMTLLVTMLVVGGLGTQLGPIVGTLIISVISVRLEHWLEARLIVLGLILLAIVIVLPRGVMPIVGSLRARLDAWADEPYDESVGGYFYEASERRSWPSSLGGSRKSDTSPIGSGPSTRDRPS